MHYVTFDVQCQTLYFGRVIKNFIDRDTERLHRRERIPRLGAFERTAQRKLLQLDSAVLLSDLNSPPGNHLEALKGDRKGQHSIRINKQWRICFRWHDGDAYDVEIVDYH
jgi:proteic killer suppression protein